VEGYRNVEVVGVEIWEKRAWIGNKINDILEKIRATSSSSQHHILVITGR